MINLRPLGAFYKHQKKLINFIDKWIFTNEVSYQSILLKIDIKIIK
jgi:hypothetical protein